MGMKKKEEIKEEISKVPLYGFYETTNVETANQLTISQQWFVKQVTENGKYILKKIR
jgi:hypothetical protein